MWSLYGHIHIELTLTTHKAISLCHKKGKVFPYSLQSVGPRADPGVQAVSPQMTDYKSPLLSDRPAFYLRKR